MDEWTLNDLLECSVCLERLDTSSKVLPCQHTFCKKCLEEIISTHKELRCPECRILVDCSVEELPPNVLLMRILEGMKNAGNLVPKKKVSNFQKQPLLQISSQHSSPNQVYNNGENFKTPNPIQKQNHFPPQPYGRAICDHAFKESGDLSFRKGEIIYLHRKVDALWYQGECGGKTGIFPASYIQVIVPLPDQVATCKALYDFRMVNDEEEGCLTFRKDDIITVIRRVDENWAEGKLNDHIGIFPLAFVEMNNVAQSLMKVSINSQPGPSRVAPPTPTTEESTPLIPTDHSAAISNHVSLHLSTQNNVINTPHHNSTVKPQALAPPAPAPAPAPALAPALAPAPAPTAVTGTESGSTVSSSTSTPSSSSITPNSSSNTSSNSNSEPNSPPSNQPAHSQNPFLAAPQTLRQMILQTSHITNSAHGVLPTSHIMGQQSATGSEQFSDPYCHWLLPQTKDVSGFTPHAKEKRHSFSAISANHHNCSNSIKHGTEITGSESGSDNQNGQLIRHGSQRHKRSGSDKTSAVNLPAGYVALYSYKPQKTDELELKKGVIYFVTERCQDGWFKGTSSKTQKSGMFPGNYVTLAKPLGSVQGQSHGVPNRESPTSLSQKTLTNPKYGKMSHMYGRQYLLPPELPPRASSPSCRLARISTQNSSTSWHPSPNEFSTLQKPAGENTTASPQTNAGAILTDPRTASSASGSPVVSASASPKIVEKVKDKKERSGLIKRLTTIKRSKSPPASSSYSMDNPVFDDAPASSQVQSHSHPVHLRSGSCPSQLIHIGQEGGPNHRTFSASVSARLKHRERPSVNNANFTHSISRPLEGTAYSKPAPSTSSSHRKSNSLDAGDATRKPRQLVPPVRERFRCIVPYPPNSEYELELKVGDIIYVHKKREDGWYKGTQQRTGRTGLFPASFVETY